MFGLFEKKREPITDKDMIKLMPADKAHFAELICDEDIPRDLYRVSHVEVTLRRQSVERKLVRCRDSVKTILSLLKKHQAIVYYVAPKWFKLEVKDADGSRVRCSARFNITSETSAGLVDWLELNVKKEGVFLSIDEVSALLNGKPKPDWLEIKDAELVAEPDPVMPIESGEDVLSPSVETVESLAIGSKLFKRWEILKEIGEGGMGKVYLAQDTMTPLEENSRVVVKVMHIETAHDPYAVEQFVKEAKILKGLRHKYIASLEDCLMLGDTPIIIMEYIEGESLADYLAQHGGVIDEKMTKELLLPIAQALDYAHGEKIFHLDVKPQNIMVRKTMKSGARTCLLDFGIAKKAHADGSMTFTMSVAGTPLYMSQEQRNGETANTAMDVYALAVTAYECLTGAMPYPHGQTMSHAVRPLTSNSSFAKAIMRGLDIVPSNRPHSCEELMNPLQIGRMKGAPDLTSGVTMGGVSAGIVDRKPAVLSREPVEEHAQEQKKSDGCDHQSAQFEEVVKFYRALLTRSATKLANSNPELADWLRHSQVRLRELTTDLANINEQEFVDVFVQIKRHLQDHQLAPDLVFSPYSDLNELRLKVQRCPGILAWNEISTSLK